MNKSSKVALGILVIVIIAAIGFMLIHNPNKKPTTATNNSASQNQNNAPAVNNAVLTTKTDSTLGQYLADPSGKPLYTYNADTANKSNCTGACLANWPAYQATGSTSSLPAGIGVITRADNGQKQYTYNGMPLYYFTADTNGKPTGDGVQNFAIAKPAATSSNTSQSTNSSSSSQSNTNSSSGYPY